MTETRTRTPFAYRTYRLATWVIWCLGWVALRLMRARSQEWRERVGEVSGASRGAVWVHAASVGEVGAAVPLVRELVSRGTAVSVTVVTPAGVRIARRSLPESVPVRFAPLDFVPVVRRTLEGTRPSLLVLIETELWPNLLFEARAQGVAVAMANARLSERSLSRYRSKASPLRGVSQLVRAATCQSDEDVRRFVRLGFDRSSVRSFGSTKFDALAEPLSAGERERLRRSFGIDPGAPVLVFGSVRPLEESAVVAAVRACLAGLPGARVIIAPRHLERVGSMAAALEGVGVGVVRRTTLLDGGDDAADSAAGTNADTGAIILDTTGELGSVYAIGDVAFVGGTLADYGGHNPLEPAAQGVPVVMGPHSEACRESAELLISAGAAVTVSSDGELAEQLLRVARDESVRGVMSAAALRVMEDGRGASARAVEWFAELGLLPERETRRGAAR